MASTRQPTRPQPARQRPERRGAAAPLILGYAAAAYLLFLAVLGYAIGFFAGAGVPTGIDSGTEDISTCSGCGRRTCMRAAPATARRPSPSAACTGTSVTRSWPGS